MPSLPSPEASRTLPSVQRVFRAVVATVIPEAAALDEAAWAEVEEAVEQALARRPQSLQRQLRLFLRALQWWPVLRHRRRFTALSDGARRQFLSHLQDHRVQRIRVGFCGLRTLALLGYYGRPPAAAEIGYRADPRGWEALR